ncbi:MAG: hypothetical protein WAN59_09600 [Candidatus Baltobacteraceae bacterium]
MTRRTLALAAALVASVGVTPALALFGPMPVFDASVFGKEVESVANEATQIQNQVTSLQNEAQNLAKIPTSYQNVQGEVAAIAGTGKAIAAETSGTVAAGTVVADSSEEAAETVRLNGLAGQANGAQSQAIVTNGYLAQQNNLIEQGNVLQAQAQVQHAAELRATAQGAADLGTTVQNATTTSVPNDL